MATTAEENNNKCLSPFGSAYDGEFFTLQHQDGEARAGLIKTWHGEIQTPMFMPVGTRATVKTLWASDLESESIDAKIILANTYHLHVRPGADLIERAGGIHGFMSWKRALLTDSGGFQIFSLSGLRKKTADGVWFQSHVDGKKFFMGPTESMHIQKQLGSDIVMMFDDCPALPATREQLRKSLELTYSWAKTCAETPLREHQHLFGIIQGGLELDLRLECLEYLKQFNLPGMAIGGLSVGEKNEEMLELLDHLGPKMPKDRPRYLMGVGTPLDLLDGVRRGIDLFDCVLPTRNARNGQFLTRHGPLSIKKERFKEDSLPPDPSCTCQVCTRYDRRYIRHLYTTGEYLSGQMISFHNISFMVQLMNQARQAIVDGEFEKFYQAFFADYQSKIWQ